MTRAENLRQMIANVDEQLAFTKTEVIIRNCHRTKEILLNELNSLNETNTTNERPSDQLRQVS